MVFWGDYTGKPIPYRGWDVVTSGEQNGTKTRLFASLKKLLEWLREYMSVDTITLLLPVADQQNLAVYITAGLEEEIIQQIRIPIGQGFAGRIAASMEPMIVNNLSAVEVVSPILRDSGLRSLVGVPVPINHEVIGVLHVGTFQSRHFTERDVQQLQLTAHRLKLIIEDAGLFNFQWNPYNQECCLAVKSFRNIFHVNQVTEVCIRVHEEYLFSSSKHYRLAWSTYSLHFVTHIINTLQNLVKLQFKSCYA